MGFERHINTTSRQHATRGLSVWVNFFRSDEKNVNENANFEERGLQVWMVGGMRLARIYSSLELKSESRNRSIFLVSYV